MLFTHKINSSMVPDFKKPIEHVGMTYMKYVQTYHNIIWEGIKYNKLQNLSTTSNQTTACSSVTQGGRQTKSERQSQRDRERGDCC